MTFEGEDFSKRGSNVKDAPLAELKIGKFLPDRAIPTRIIVLALVAVFIIPGIIFAGILLTRYAESERAKYALSGIGVANAVTTVLDQHLAGLRTTLQTLATSPLLRQQSWEAFHSQAREVRTLIGAEIGLRTIDGELILTTRLPWGAPLPPSALPLQMDEARTSPTISAVYTGGISRQPEVAIIAPVLIDGKPRYFLDISTETRRLLEIVKEVTPPDWVIGVGDSAGNYVLRSEDHEEFSGKPANPAYIARAQGPAGTFVGESAFGEKVQVGYARSPLSEWLIAANIKQSILQAPLMKGLYYLAGYGLIVLAISSILALWLGGFITRPLKNLAQASANIGSAEADFSTQTPLREFAHLRDALAAASEEVRLNRILLETRVAERTKELQQTNKELEAQIAAREEAEDHLRQAQKMEAIGQLTGGIAHDFNNMLAVIISSLTLFEKRDARGDKDTAKFIESAKDGAQRAAGLTKRLLAFSRQQPLEPSVIQLNQIVSSMSELLQRTLGGAIGVETVLAAGLWKTFADANQVESAIVNLAVNARDAMPETGKLTIETANCFLDEDYVRPHGDLAAGQYVMIAVTDTGSGMEQNIIDRAFDPFFTTKPMGAGTGLGLSQVYGFVKQSKGHIKIYSEVGQGTSVKIYLPRFTGDGEKTALAQHSSIPSLAGSADEIVMVVEDDDDLRRVTVSLLEELGYTVLATGEPSEALKIIEKRPEISILFTDIVMPEMSGRKLAEEAVKIRPGLPVLFTTGFTRNAIVHNGMLDSGVHFIAKPFSIEELGGKLRAVLENPKSGGSA